MASNTNNLGLLKKDPVADGNDTFNIRTMLNENWDKIDEFAGKTTPISKGGTGATTAAQALSNLGAAAVSAVGNLHVWERVQSGVTDYLTSTDRNAYPDNVTDAQDAYYSLGDVVSGTIVPVTTSQVQFKYSTTVTVYDNGDLNVDGDVVNLQNYNTDGTSTIKGKYIVPVTTGASISGVWFIPSDATFSLISEDGNPTKLYLYCDKMQPVTGHAAIPANTTITYHGQLGGGARIEVGSYVGTGTYGSSNPCSVSASFQIKRLSVFGEIYANTGNYFPIYENSNNSSYSMHDILLTTSFASRRGIHKGTSSYDLTYSFGKKSADGKTFWWYSSGNAASFQLNESGSTYYYIAIG